MAHPYPAVLFLLQPSLRALKTIAKFSPTKVTTKDLIPRWVNPTLTLLRTAASWNLEQKLDKVRIQTKAK